MDTTALKNDIKTLEKFAATIYEFSSHDLDMALESALKCMEIVLKQET